MNTYNVIKSNVEELIVILSKHQEMYNKSPVKSYYDLRDKFDRDATNIERGREPLRLTRLVKMGCTESIEMENSMSL